MLQQQRPRTPPQPDHKCCVNTQTLALLIKKICPAGCLEFVKQITVGTRRELRQASEFHSGGLGRFQFRRSALIPHTCPLAAAPSSFPVASLPWMRYKNWIPDWQYIRVLRPLEVLQQKKQNKLKAFQAADRTTVT